jgi:hypothetical protein
VFGLHIVQERLGYAAVSSHTSLLEDSCVDRLLTAISAVPVMCALDLATREIGNLKDTSPIFFSGASGGEITLAIGQREVTHAAV